MRTLRDKTKNLHIRKGLHQGSALTPYSFNLVLDVLTRYIHKIIPDCIVFSDDIVLIKELGEDINYKLEYWRDFGTWFL